MEEGQCVNENANMALKLTKNASWPAAIAAMLGEHEETGGQN